MQNNIFYSRVSSWIRSYRNPDALQYVRNFVDNSTEPVEVKEALYKEIDYKAQRLREMSKFKEVDGMSYLCNDNYEIIEFETRFGAVCRISTLLLRGYDVHLKEVSNTCYRIVLYEEHKDETIADHYAGMVANA